MGRPTYYEFFAGGGMARAGLGSSWKCLFANDFDRKKGETYRANWGSEALLVGDVRTLETKQLPGHADLIWASFPARIFRSPGPEPASPARAAALSGRFSTS